MLINPKQTSNHENLVNQRDAHLLHADTHYTAIILLTNPKTQLHTWSSSSSFKELSKKIV